MLNTRLASWAAFITIGMLYSSSMTAASNLSSISAQEFIHARCAAAPQGTNYIVAHGDMYGALEDAAPQKLFRFLGVDISRCIQDQAGDHYLLSRKLSLYLDPDTGEMMRIWLNPFTGERLNVIHRVYDYQEFKIPETIEAVSNAKRTWVSFGLNAGLPNPLYGDDTFDDYAPEEVYYFSLAYKYNFPTAAKGDAGVDPEEISESFFQKGVFEPWMKMGHRKGYTVIKYTGHMVRNYDEIPQILRDIIHERLPLYRSAPPCRANVSNATSWTRFAQYFDAYRAGKTFPLPAPATELPCKSP